MKIRRFQDRWQIYFNNSTKRASAPTLIGAFGVYLGYKIGFIK